MSNERLREALKDHAEFLKKRADWQQRMIEQNSQTILNAQKLLEHFQTELQVTNSQLDSLRAEYRKLIDNGTTSKE